VNHVSTLHDTPSGDAETVSFEIWGHPFMAISARPLFRFNPSISFMVNFDPSRDQNARELLDSIWERLSEDMDRMMREGTPGQVDRVTQAFLPMEKIDFAELRKAYEGR
jgi:predicted 3-demethylubiquinone-9 3-methyltransferase (glyoxalase superfamily)